MFNTICRFDNFLNPTECNALIKEFNNNLKHTKVYRDTITLKIIYKPVFNKLKNIFSFFNFDNPDNMEIVLWNKDSKMKPHYDTGDILSFIVYLNDNYSGGETLIDDIKITPKTGRLILFSNGFYLHKVNKIKDKKRYTLIGWYK